MFQFGGFPLLTKHHGFRRTHSEKSHSGFLGSKATCAYPRRFAACRALLRRLKPSHSPDGVACRAYSCFGSSVCLTFEELRLLSSGRRLWCLHGVHCERKRLTPPFILEALGLKDCINLSGAFTASILFAKYCEGMFWRYKRCAHDI